MSEVKVNKISPRSGTAITLGDSGDTFTIPSGATLAIAGSVTGFTSAGIDDNATSVAITIDSSERVGIGTTSPSRKLHVLGSAGTVQIQSTGTSSTLYFADTNSSTIDNQGVGSSGNDIFIMAGGSERMRIDSSGNVGIGDTSPSAKLDVRSQINVTNSNGNSLQAVTGTRWGYSSSYKVVALGGVNTGTSNTTAIGYDPSGNPGASFTGTGSELLFRNGVEFTTPNSADDGFHHDLIVLKDGNVGIGTTSPEKQLTLSSTDFNPLLIKHTDGGGAYVAFMDNSTTDSSEVLAGAVGNAFNIHAGDSERMRITSSGSVGIGTTSPANNLHIFTDASGEGILVKSTGNTYNDIIGDSNRSGAGNNLVRFRGNWNGNGVAMIALSAGDDTTNKDDGRIEFFTSASGSSQNNRMVIEPNGNVGIGTTSPTRTLHVDASGGANVEISRTGLGGLYFESDGTNGITRSTSATGSLIFQTNGNNERMRITSAGVVGIGTSSPHSISNLHVADTYANEPMIRIETSDGGNKRLDLYVSGGHGYITATQSAQDLNFATRTNLIFKTNTSSERMRIDSSGHVLVGTTSTTINSSNHGVALYSSGEFKNSRNVDGASVCAQFYGTTGLLQIRGDGDAENTGNSYGGISDRTLKENEVDANSQWNDIKSLQIKNYNLIEYPDRTQLGVIAQDLEASGMNGLVKTDDQGIKSVKYSVLYMKAVKALQEAIERIETLEARITQLENA